MNTQVAVFSSVALVCLSGTRVPEDNLTFGPAPQTELTKTFSEETTWELEDIRRLVNGNEFDMGPVEMSGVASRESVFNDTYLELDDTRATLLTREVEAVGGLTSVAMGMDEIEEYEYSLASELEGAELILTWNEASEVTDVKFAPGEEGDEDLLEGLREDTDLRSLLPRSGATKGDSWDVDPQELSDVFAPGGDWSLMPVGFPSGPFAEVDAEDVVSAGVITLADMAQEIDGDVRATWVRTFEADGARVAEVKVAVELDVAGTVEDQVAEWCEHVDLPPGRGDLGMRYERRVEGEATLLWNLSEGHFQHFEFNAESYVTADMHWNQGELRIEVELEFSASTTLSADAE